MKHIILASLAAAVVATAGGLAFAQQDPINSAPSYSAPAPTGTGTQNKIIDGINGAPNYNAMPPATAGASQAAKINDGNNPSPNYGTPTASAPAPKARAAKAKSMGPQHATTHHRHKMSTSASHG